jgi:hypothetical protein
MCANGLSYNEFELPMETSMNQIRILFTITIMVTLLQMPTASAEQEGTRPEKLFKSDETMDVSLTGPWRDLEKKSDEDRFWPAQLTYTDSNGQQLTIDIEVTPRGLTRRNKICDFPPLKLHFDKEKMKGTTFSGNNSLKLVTWCDDNKRYQDYNLKEYLAYRIYNLVTEKSFRVRSLNITWLDNASSAEPLQRFGFLIEDPDEVAKRNDMVKLEIPRVSYARLDSLETSRYVLFQYLIGNLDWSAIGGLDEIKCCHNSRLIGVAKNINPVYAIPYDFDVAGVVDAHYALTPESLPVRRVTQRLFRGYCIHNDTLPQARDEFIALKTDIIGLYRDEARLSDKGRDKAVEFLEEFFETVSDPKDFQKDIIGKCRN